MSEPYPGRPGEYISLHDLLVVEAELPRPELDPSDPPVAYLRGARTGSGTFRARCRTWRAECALERLRDQMVESDERVIRALLWMAVEAGTDKLTIKREDLAKRAKTPERTVRDALRRLAADGWLTVISSGASAKGRPSGSAAEYRLWPGPTQFTPRRRGGSSSVGRPIGGRAQPDLDIDASPPTKESQIPPPPRNLRVLVSGRADLGVVQDENCGGVQDEKPCGVQDEKPAGGWTGAEVEGWLRGCLLVGPQVGAQMVMDAQAVGINRKALDRAKGRMGVTVTDGSFGGEGRGRPPQRIVLWSLPRITKIPS